MSTGPLKHAVAQGAVAPATSRSRRSGRLGKRPVAFGLLTVATALVSTLAASTASATAVSPAHAVPGSNLLYGVACPSVTSCVAVGVVLPGFAVTVPITNGIPGDAQLLPGPSGALAGVACPSITTCLAVGYQFVSVDHRLTEEAVVVPIINGTPGPAQLIPDVMALNGVACSSPTTCYAVGSASSHGVVVPITNGVVGSVQPVAEADVLNAVACSSSSTCYAVGNSSSQGVVVPINNGVVGAAQLDPGSAFLSGVACSGAASCFAVGLSADFFNPVLLPITNGMAGVAQAVPNVSALTAIACPNATTCLAVGFTGAGVVVPIVDGVLGVPLAVAGSNGLYGIDCPSATLCEVVGGNASGQGVVASIGLSPPCTTTITGNHVGTLVPGAGVTCLSGAHLTGSLVVPRGATLEINNSTITGSIIAIGPAGLQLCATTVKGSVTVKGATGFVLVGDPGDDRCAPNTIAGSLTLQNNTHGLDAIGNRVKGAVLISGNSGAGPIPEDSAPEMSGNGP